MRPRRPRAAGVSRRGFLAGLPAGAWGLAGGLGPWGTRPASAAVTRQEAALPAMFPGSDPEIVKALVTVAHMDVDEVRRLVERQPSLARASWDWGYGDWETGLGAAAHTGRRDIADVLLAHGARPTIFSAAMMGELDVVKAFVAARPGVQGTLGPHGLTLMLHARAGGKDAEAVVAYLEAVGGADVRPPSAPLDAADRDAVVGAYVFGRDERDRFEVDVQNDQLGLQRPGTTRRFLIHTGNLVFFPSGVPSVKIAFVRDGGRVVRLTIADPEVFVTARRV
ncbi:MAG: hypothetical protein AB7O67_08670 [Vicinamibacterales bacterium]